MNVVVLILRAWAAGLGMALVLAWVTVGSREAVRILLASALPSLAGFSAIALILYLPALHVITRMRGEASPIASAIICALLGALVVALIASVYGDPTWWVMSHEKAFMFALLAVPGAVFGAAWARQRSAVETKAR